MMEEIESERDLHKERCCQLEGQLEISQKIVSTQEIALAAKEVSVVLTTCLPLIAVTLALVLL